MSKKIEKVQGNLAKMKVVLSKCQAALERDTETNEAELAKLQQMLAFIEKANKVLDDKKKAKDPIKKTIGYNAKLYLDANVCVKGWYKKDKKSGKPALEKENILLKEGMLDSFDIYSNMDLELYVWSKGCVQNVGVASGNLYEYGLVKNTTLFVTVDKDGNFSVEHLSETEKLVNGSNRLKEQYEMKLNVIPTNGGKTVKIIAEAILPGSKETVEYPKLLGKKGISETEIKPLTLRSFSPTFELRLKDNPQKQTVPTTKELIFESENQAVLSSDQRGVCLEWWNSLSPQVKEDIREQRVKVIIQGFASPPGSNEYNNQLGLDRAKNTAKLLTPKIGTNIKGDPLCRFELIGEGETTDDPRKYVRITIK